MWITKIKLQHVWYVALISHSFVHAINGDACVFAACLMLPKFTYLQNTQQYFQRGRVILGGLQCSKIQSTLGMSQPFRYCLGGFLSIKEHKARNYFKTCMLRKGVISPSSSPWTPPVVLAKKKDGTLRFCIDFKKLNAVTRKDAYRLPRIDDTLDSLSGSRWFSTLDLACRYWQVEIAHSDREKTAFSTPEGQFEFKVMPFGLNNAPAMFQRLTDLVLSGLQWAFCLVYLDDIIVMGRSFEEHLQNMEWCWKDYKEPLDYQTRKV